MKQRGNGIFEVEDGYSTSGIPLVNNSIAAQRNLALQCRAAGGLRCRMRCLMSGQTMSWWVSCCLAAMPCEDG